MSGAGGIRVFAPAKINLFLHVGAMRSDGFHDVLSLVAFADVGDVLALVDAPGLALGLDGPFGAALVREPNNLVLQAARALARQAGRSANAQMRLNKNLPVAGGLGGGSADAAAALRGLSDLWRLDMAAENLRAVGAALGSDVPVCVASVPAWMEGRGERVTPVSLPPLPAVLVNPGVAVSTAEVFARLKNRSGVETQKPAAFHDVEALLSFLDATVNDLEAPAIGLAPAINEALIALAAAQARLARMSGSGATCFGLFESTARAEAAAAAIAGAHSDWWVKAARLVPLRAQ